MIAYDCVQTNNYWKMKKGNFKNVMEYIVTIRIKTLQMYHHFDSK